MSKASAHLVVQEGGREGGIHWVRRRYKEVVRMVGWEDGELQLIYTFRCDIKAYLRPARSKQMSRLQLNIIM